MLHHAMDGRIGLAVGLLLFAVATAAATEPAETELAAPQATNECGFPRAGNPECIARRARPSNGPGDTGYYVGGGAPFHGSPRMISEGTWGWDYAGPFCFRRIDLGWWHGARYQGGPGQYQPDGPRLLHH